MPSIDILLATYNGERFLAQQIDSLFAQTEQDWRLLIRDDGSTDSTVSIIEKYKSRYSEKIVVLKDEESRAGVIGNFSRLINQSVAPYVMLCDQDDIWNPDKIELSLKIMKELEKRHGAKKPLLLHTDLRIVDESLRTVADSFMKRKRINPHRSSLKSLLLTNIVTGCTMIANRALLTVSGPIPQAARMHDMWLALVAAAFGYIDFLDTPTIQYRVHENSVVGDNKRRFLSAITHFCATRRSVQEGMSRNINQAEVFLDRYKDRLSEADKDILSRFIGLKDLGFVQKRLHFLNDGFSKHGLVDNLGLYLFA